ncbi:type II toxin-antitoxin system prevent-host-death family antitoxin [Verticiella sediminum]|uniref:Antitoxin n=1 Tax=Verticiella sediminum TaxID=1247510 RepID=A0A556B0I4_9BURK|nr:type II toxin-antitoxin system prevent-host-death family antitoxin [Verticiella sediminum]TSH98644.1 type II toxin-antitoxin system prevent-host-death family antitoxin [Verticiella sediminum]
MKYDVSAADANRRFSRILREVREEGRSYVVTSHGRPVARIVPIDERRSAVTDTRAVLLSRLRTQPIVQAGSWTRDELYERPQRRAAPSQPSEGDTATRGGPAFQGEGEP